MLGSGKVVCWGLEVGSYVWIVMVVGMGDRGVG